MTKAAIIDQPGPPDVFRYRDIEVGDPGKGEIRVRHSAIGLNYIDTYHRTGLYPMKMPLIVGMEGTATVTAVGKGVKDLKVGDRIAYGSGPPGSYAEERVMPAWLGVRLPKGIDDDIGASMMLKGMTAQYLLHSTYKVKKGDTILVHAAAGGVGLILCQWAKHLGARVIGTVGSEDKAALAKKHGCHHPIVYTKENFVEAALKITKGKKLPVVYDSIGQATFPASLDLLQPRGMFVSFGNASGPIKSFDAGLLASKGSLFMTRPSLPHHLLSREELLSRANALFKVVKSGAVKIEVNQHYALKDAARAHVDLESRKTTGSTVLIP
jgi:NADPH2:quinone reductase